MAGEINKLKGHESQWKRLREQIAADRLPHGLAFVGPAGIGKRRFAQNLAQAALCASPSSPCGVCGDCLRVGQNQHEGLMNVAPQGSSLKIEQAHGILSFLSLRAVSRRRFVIIDDASSMTPSFGNALLKILEEPPPATHFIFITQAMSQLLPTLRSRLQAVRFFPLADEVLAESGSPSWMIHAAGGSFARLEQWQSSTSTELKTQAISALSDLGQGRRDGIDALLEIVREKERADLAATFLQQFLRDAYLRKLTCAGLVHADCAPALDIWTRFPASAILALWNEAHKLGGDIASNLDRVLSF